MVLVCQKMLFPVQGHVFLKIRPGLGEMVVPTFMMTV